MNQLQTAVPARVLVVDDERTTRHALCEALNLAGHQASYAASGDEALAMLAQEFYQVVILDLQMPGIDGVKVLKVAETMASDTAFIVFTGYASTETAVAALRSGAVDYLRKPCSFETIFAAVDRAVDKQQERFRQKQAARLLEEMLTNFSSLTPKPQTKPFKQGIVETAEFSLNERQQTAIYRGTPLDLTPIEYKLLHCFVRQPDTVLSYSQLAFQTHGTEIDEEEARPLLRTHLYRLNNKLGGKEQSPLKSVRGRGFILYTTA